MSLRYYIQRFRLKTFLVLKKKFLRYDMVAILFNSAEPFEQIDKTLSTESPMWNLVNQFVREKDI